MISLTREQYLDSIQKLRDQGASFSNRLSSAQLGWQPVGGARWSILEILDHLAVFNGGFLNELGNAAANAPAGGRAGEIRAGGFVSEKFIGFSEPPPKAKVKATANLAPRPTLNPEKIGPEFLASMDRVANFVRSTSGKDLNAVRFKNPFIPLLRFTAASGLLIIGSHTRRHMYQAEQILKEPDFPKS
ncbi:MAG TPA: DinB family protein [Bryobacteraceae bacterium]|nr:DinB family protein [Bryobacteraceae bacterium]